MQRRSPLATLLAGAVLTACGAVAAEQTSPLPESLLDTALFVPGSNREVGADSIPFSPQYPLWSDGAAKRRWLYLPPGTAIDASQPDAWEFPVGARLWKEFSLAGRPVETRLIERLPDGQWRYATYVWTDDGRDARLAPADGIRALPRAGAPSGRYAIPSEYDCRACHEGAAVPALGFSALQLSADRDPLAPHAESLDVDQLRAFVERGVVRNLPATLLARPPRIAAETPVERAALGYLHGNCGHCHAAPTAAGASVPVPALLAQSVVAPERRASDVRRSLIGASSRFRPHGASEATRIIAPGSAAHSVLPYRMRSRDPRVQMPPLGTAVIDHEALALIERWISQDLSPREEPHR